MDRAPPVWPVRPAFSVFPECDTDRTPRMHDIQLRQELPGYAVKGKRHDGVAVLVGHVVPSIRPEAAEAGRFAPGRGRNL